jgi:sugar phosphate isomerase/epimerase
MQISFSTGTFYHRGLRYSLDLAHETGYDGVELALGPEYTIGGIRRLRRSALGHPVPVLSVHPPFLRLPGWPRQVSRSIPYMMEVTEALGVTNCVLHVPALYSKASLRAERFILGLQEAQRVTGGALRVGLENNQYDQHKQRYLLDDLRALVDFAQDCGCGVTFDTCHAGANGEDILACYDIVRPVLYNVHLNDVEFRNGVPHTHIPPGQGQLPLDRFLGLLSGDGYDGLVTLEIYPGRVGLLSRGRHLEELRKAIAYVRAAMAQPIAR